MLSGSKLREKLEETLTRIGIDYRSIIDSFGQVQASEERTFGKIFDLRDHVRGMILSQLSNQRPWGPIAANMPHINKLFYDYNPEKLKITEPSELVKGLQKLRCGNRSIQKQMDSLSINIQTFERIASEQGSIDAFVTSESPSVISKKLSDAGKYKLVQIGFTLALEYLRNVGITTIKPDVHVRRTLSSERLGFSQYLPSEIEAYEILMHASEESGINPIYLDNLLWLFCAQDYGNICGSNPKCAQCSLIYYCAYPDAKAVCPTN